MMSERKRWIDICRGIAIVLVVMGHIGNAYNGNLRILHDVIYFFHMPLFMFISGYLGSYSKGKSFEENCKRKIVAYVVPYVTFSAVYWFFKMLGSAVVNNPTDFKELLLIPIYPISFMWYIYALLFIVFFVEIIKKHFKFYKQIILISAIVCYMVWLLFMNNSEFINSEYKNLIFVDVIKHYIWYALGYSLGNKIIEVCKYIYVNKIAAIFGSVMGYIILFGVAIIDVSGVSLLNFVLAILGIFCTVVISMIIEKNKLIEYLGRNTLPIYVLHGTVTSVVQLIFARIGDINAFFLVLICTLLGITVSMLGYEICKKVWWLDSLFYPNKYIARRRQKEND